MEHAAPACLVEKVNNYMDQKGDPVCHGGALVLVFRHIKRPINKERPANHIFLRNKSPETAVQAHIPIVAHAEIAIRRNYQLAVFINMIAHNQRPYSAYL